MLFILAGSLSFLISSIILIFRSLSQKKYNKPLLFLITITLFAVFPLYLLARYFNPITAIRKLKKQKGLLKLNRHTISTVITGILLMGAVVALILPVWVGTYIGAAALTLDRLNLVTDTIPVAGTGSMYPTFPKGLGKTLKEQTKELVGTPGMMRYPSGFSLFGQKFFSYDIGRGDIVSFYNAKTVEITKKDGLDPSGFIKRVIALPGDKIEIRDGLLLLNSKPQKEPYIAKAHSTFGGDFLPDCKTLTIPANKLFVMGDNRKGSGDSRHELALIDFKDINHVIPLKSQKGVLDKNWHNTDKDFDEATKIKLDKTKYLQLLNEKRKEAGVKPLAYQTKLEISAAKRGTVMLENDDLSFEATRSGYTMDQAMADAGYYNVTWGEIPTLGYYEADELLDNQFQFPDFKNFLLRGDFQDIGVAEVEGTLNGCPAQVIVQHFAGYVPPNYKQSDIDGWKDLLSKIKAIQPGWGKLKESTDFYNKYKQDVDRINEVISIRVSNISAIISRMEANQWLTADEKKMIPQDVDLAKEQDSLATKLNNNH